MEFEGVLLITAGLWDDLPAAVWSDISFWNEGKRKEDDECSENDFWEWLLPLWWMLAGSASGFDWHREGSEGPNSNASSGEPGQREIEHRDHRAAIKRR